jgi:starvation-inducible DNA-binding protein
VGIRLWVATKGKHVKHQYAPPGLETGEAEKLGAILQDRLSTLIDLSLILKHVHWNVVGAGFIAVHEMMDTQTEETRAMVDEIAERITTLGGVAAGLASQVVELRSADGEYALGRAPVMAHLGALDKVYERVGAGHREAIEQVSGVDPISEDLLITQTATLEQNHWFIRAHISDTDGRLATEGTASQLDAATAAAHALQPGLAFGDAEPEATEDAAG